MTYIDLNETILNELHKASTDERTPAQILFEVLHLSKESAYRRLRSDVKFTLDEAAKLSLALNFSLDLIIGNTTLEKSVFDISTSTLSDNYFNNVIRKLDDYVEFAREMENDTSSKAMFALNCLPYTFYLGCDNVSRFKHYKWLYQSATAETDLAYSDIRLSDELIEKQRAYVTQTKKITQTIYIFDRNVFSSVKYDIEYFYNLNLITIEDVKLLKKELLEMLNRIETIAKNGKFDTGKAVAIYISSVDIEASYSLYEYCRGSYSHLRIYGMSGVDTHSKSTARKQKEWIESHKRYSTVISKSGEMHRLQYFNAQRKAIESIVNPEL